jgi:hypothetical protein
MTALEKPAPIAWVLRLKGSEPARYATGMLSTLLWSTRPYARRFASAADARAHRESMGSGPQGEAIAVVAIRPAKSARDLAEALDMALKVSKRNRDEAEHWRNETVALLRDLSNARHEIARLRHHLSPKVEAPPVVVAGDTHPAETASTLTNNDAGAPPGGG